MQQENPGMPMDDEALCQEPENLPANGARKVFKVTCRLVKEATFTVVSDGLAGAEVEATKQLSRMDEDNFRPTSQPFIQSVERK